MIMRLLCYTLLSLYALIPAQAHMITITDAQLDAIIKIESSGDPAALGDQDSSGNYLAKGLAQFHQAAWIDTTAYRAHQGKPTHPYSKATDPVIARDYLRSWLECLANRYHKDTGLIPNTRDIYAMHNLGYAGYKSRGYYILNCPAITRKKALSL